MTNVSYPQLTPPSISPYSVTMSSLPERGDPLIDKLGAYFEERENIVPTQLASTPLSSSHIVVHVPAAEHQKHDDNTMSITQPVEDDENALPDTFPPDDNRQIIHRSTHVSQEAITAYANYMKQAAEEKGVTAPKTPKREEISKSILEHTDGNREFELCEGVCIEDSPLSSRVLIKKVGQGVETTAYKALHFEKFDSSVTVTCVKENINSQGYRKDALLAEYLPKFLNENQRRRSMVLLPLNFINRRNHQQQECRYFPMDFTKLPSDSSTDTKRLIFAYLNVIEGLFFLHRASIIHRDLKPLNCLFDPNEKTAMLTDLGHIISEQYQKSSGTTAGTPLYMDPWMFESLIDQTKRKGMQTKESDIYALARSIEHTLMLFLVPNYIYAKPYEISDDKLNRLRNKNPLKKPYFIWVKQKTENENPTHIIFRFDPIKNRRKKLLEATENDPLLTTVVKIIYKILQTPPEHLLEEGQRKRYDVQTLLDKFARLAIKADPLLAYEQGYCSQSDLLSLNPLKDDLDQGESSSTAPKRPRDNDNDVTIYHENSSRRKLEFEDDANGKREAE